MTHPRPAEFYHGDKGATGPPASPEPSPGPGGHGSSRCWHSTVTVEVAGALFDLSEAEAVRYVWSVGASVGLEFEPEPMWLRVPDEGDLEVWARETAARVWAERAERGEADPDDADWLPREVLASQLLLLGNQVRRSKPEMAFVFLPLEETSPALVVEVLVGDLPEGVGEEEMVGELLWPAEELVEDPEVTTVQTGAGPAIKLRQRFTSGPEGRAGDSTAYLWPVPDEQALIVAHTVNFDLTIAGRAQAALDELARSCRLIQA